MRLDPNRMGHRDRLNQQADERAARKAARKAERRQARASRRGGRRRLGGVLASFVMFAAIAGGVIAIMFTGGAHDAAMSELRACPAAEAALGDGIRMRLGWALGQTETSGSTGSASWSYPVRGEDARGRYAWSASKTGGQWHLYTGTLTVGDTEIDVVRCLGVVESGAIITVPTTEKP